MVSSAHAGLRYEPKVYEKGKRLDRCNIRHPNYAGGIFRVCNEQWVPVQRQVTPYIKYLNVPYWRQMAKQYRIQKQNSYEQHLRWGKLKLISVIWPPFQQIWAFARLCLQSKRELSKDEDNAILWSFKFVRIRNCWRSTQQVMLTGKRGFEERSENRWFRMHTMFSKYRNLEELRNLSKCVSHI